MATSEGVNVDVDAGTVQISELTIEDPELVDFLETYERAEHTDVVNRALRVGMHTLRLSKTSKDVEHVKREFSELETRFEEEIEDIESEIEDKFGEKGEVAEVLNRHLGEEGHLKRQFDNVFGEEGQFADRLDDELGEDGERIQEALDPDRDGTPTNRLKKNLKEEIQDLRDSLVEEEAQEEMIQQTTKKGDVFEDTVGRLLDDLVYGSNDTYEFTGDTEGELTGRDVGDFVMTLGDSGQDIVIEAKSDQSYNQPSIQGEMEDALANRDADYGLFVMDCESYVPDKVGYFQEYNREYAVVCLREDEDAEVEQAFLEMAVNWARMRAISKKVDTGGSVDMESIQDHVGSVRDTIDSVSNLKRKCTDLQDTAEEISTSLEELKGDVNDDLNRITAELSKSS